MAWLSVSDLKRVTERNRNTGSDAAIMFATDRATASGRHSVRVGLSRMLAASIGIIQGDRVDVFFDADARLCKIVKAKAGGIKTSSANSSSKKARITIKTTWVPGMASVPQSVACTDFICSKDEVVFTIPQPVSFERNLRVD